MLSLSISNVKIIIYYRRCFAIVNADPFIYVFSNDDFAMFGSMLDHKDLIFQDSTVRLVEVPKEKQFYQEYLGESFMRAMQRMENIDCITNSASGLHLFSAAILLLGCLLVRQLL